MKDEIQSPFSRAPLLAITKQFPQLDFDSLVESQLSADLLCTLAQGQSNRITKRFVCQDSLLHDSRYYEQIIYEDNIIPTRRGSWHDFFNGLIWLCFPKTKAYLNRLHISEIKQFGVHPRTNVRNQITHFDECGVVLFVEGRERLSALQAAFDKQQWSFIFCELQDQWFSKIRPSIFGHANLEMLLKPFIGLTGKVLLLEVKDIAAETKIVTKSKCAEGCVWDGYLLAHLQQNKSLHDKKPFYPFPMLGVPHWHYAKQDEAFYADTSYFMPKRQQKAGV